MTEEGCAVDGASCRSFDASGAENMPESCFLSSFYYNLYLYSFTQILTETTLTPPAEGRARLAGWASAAGFYHHQRGVVGIPGFIRLQPPKDSCRPPV